MTLDGAAWLTIFALFGLLLCFSAWILENAEPDPISERRDMAHREPMAHKR